MFVAGLHCRRGSLSAPRGSRRELRRSSDSWVVKNSRSIGQKWSKHVRPTKFGQFHPYPACIGLISHLLRFTGLQQQPCGTLRCPHEVSVWLLQKLSNFMMLSGQCQPNVNKPWFTHWGYPQKLGLPQKSRMNARNLTPNSNQPGFICPGLTSCEKCIELLVKVISPSLKCWQMFFLPRWYHGKGFRASNYPRCIQITKVILWTEIPHFICRWAKSIYESPWFTVFHRNPNSY